MTDGSRTPRLATPDDVDLIARIGAEGFYDDPVLSWVMADPATRLEKLTTLFAGLARDMTSSSASEVWIVDDACVAMWRTPSHDHHPATEEQDGDDGGGSADESPFDAGELARLGVLGETMQQHHPHEPHWYLNLISTLPSHQGQGLGAAVIGAVLPRCDTDRTRAYLESTNPRNRTLYRRSGFVDADEMQIPDGPTMLAMWRDPVV